MSKVDLSQMTDEELVAELQRRKIKKANSNNSKFNTVSMEEAFRLAKEWEVDKEYSIKFGYPNIETNWIRWICDNNLNMKPFTNWYDEDGKKLKHLPKLDENGGFPGWATIALFVDGEVIQRIVSSCGGKLFGILYEHCRQ